MTLLIDHTTTNADWLQDITSFLNCGEICAIPTETVYGLAGRADMPDALIKIYEAKKRPKFNPLICHVADIEMAAQHVQMNKKAEILADAFWPGALTLVLPKKDKSTVHDLASAGLDTLAVRCPVGPLAECARELSAPLAAPSANLSGYVSATCARDVLDDLKGRISAVLDAGPCTIGIESTILSLCDDKPIILRSGGITRDALENILGEEIALYHSQNKKAPIAPGMLSSHYAPCSKMRLNADTLYKGEALLAFGTPVFPVDKAVSIAQLSAERDLQVASYNLFSHLRMLDACGADQIAVMPIPNEGLGEAINDRLKRAAAPKY
jgi:L-threonylcarbamoyladenylate synthase